MYETGRIVLIFYNFTGMLERIETDHPVYILEISFLSTVATIGSFLLGQLMSFTVLRCD